MTMSRITTLIFAIAAGLSVANIYYAQPLLDTMVEDFGISPGTIGLIVTMIQLGYALGLIFIVPLGDLVDRRRLARLEHDVGIGVETLGPFIRVWLNTTPLLPEPAAKAAQAQAGARYNNFAATLGRGVNEGPKLRQEIPNDI